MNDVWIFFIFPILLLFLKNHLLLKPGRIKKGGIFGRTIEWFVAAMMIVGIVRAIAASIVG